MKTWTLLTLEIPAIVSLLAVAGCATPTARPVPVATGTLPVTVSASPITPTPGVTPKAPPVLTGTAALTAQESEELVRFIVNELAQGGKRTDRYVAQARSVYSPPSGSLRKDSASLEGCWLYQSGDLRRCSPVEFSESYEQEQARNPWKYAYAVFGVVSIDSNRTQAMVQLDEYLGRMASSGILFTLIRVNGQWREQSRRVLFVS